MDKFDLDIDRLVEQEIIPEVILVGIGHLNTIGTNMRGWDFHSYRTPKLYLVMDTFSKF